MPLIKSASKKAVGKNIKKEVAAGKPRKQAIAIALSTQRKAGGKVASKKAIVAKKSTKAGSKFNARKFENARKKVFNLPKSY